MHPYISMYHHRHGVDASVISEDDVEYWKREAEYDPSDEDEYLTDASLPAPYRYAQDMLDVLEDAKEELIYLYERMFPGDESANETTATIDRVIAVIDKASGEEEKD